MAEKNSAAEALYHAGNTIYCDFETAMRWAYEQHEWEIKEQKRWLALYPDPQRAFDLEENALRQIRLGALIHDLHSMLIDDAAEALRLTLAEMRQCSKQPNNALLSVIADCLEDSDYTRLAI